MAYNLRSILCVAIESKGRTDWRDLCRQPHSQRNFHQKDLGLLVAFANQAAVAIENARLFDSVLQSLAE